MEHISQAASTALLPRSEPKHSLKSSTLIINAVTELASVCVLRGQLKSGAETVLVKDLLNDLREMPADQALAALAAHKRASPFFPHISDLMGHVSTLRAYLSAREAGHYDTAQAIRETAETGGSYVVSDHWETEVLVREHQLRIENAKGCAVQIEERRS